MTAMTRLALTCLLVAATGLEGGVALAKSKAFCRGYAEETANALAGPRDAGSGSAVDGGNGLGFSADAGGASDTVSPVTRGDAGSDEWRRTYRAAYSECRAS
ncbi:MAG: hypothetical protein NTU78_17520 [Alphaproteobacteria bacterium]|jgi:hypothetical protein|nr:hypothetical protein [Alphaproteobacteria bacterium]